MKKEFGSDYASISDVNFTVKYRASCYCNAVQYEVCSDPVDAKICHCLACQKLHGAPMQWAAIFHKHDVRITEGIYYVPPNSNSGGTYAGGEINHAQNSRSFPT